MNSLKEKISKYYNDITLSEDQFAKLEMAQYSARPSLFHWRPYVIASLIFVVVITLYPKGSNLEKVAEEIIYNHRKNLPSEFLTGQISDLNSKLLKLDFKLIASARIAHMLVMGGRYCSIQGRIAAQVKMKDNGRDVTLYQSMFSEINETKLPYRFSKDGVEVAIWVEDKILFAIAMDVDDKK